MTNPANSDVQNLLPVQAYFSIDGTFQTFIGQGKPFYAIPNPDQSGLHITNSTIDSSVIGGTTPAAGTFTSIATTTGTITTAPSGPNDIVNKYYVDLLATGLAWKQPVVCATTPSGGNITLSGLQTIDTVTVTAGQRVLVKNQTNTADNGIYLAASGAWSRALDANTWDELIGAIVFITEGGQRDSAWYSTTQAGGTLGVTPIVFQNFTISAIYTAGTGLQLIGTEFSIANTSVVAGSYGSASQSLLATVNAQGQLTGLSAQTISIAVSQLNNLGTGVGSALTTNVGSAGSVVVNGGALGAPTSGNFGSGTFTWPTFNQNTSGYAAGIAGGAAGSLPYQTAANTTGFLAIGTDGYILSIASGVPAWIPNTVGTVTSVSGTGTINGLTLTGTVTSSGSLTLGGTLDLSSPPAIGGTTAAAITGTVITANTNFASENYYALSILGGNLRTSGGTSLLNWDGGGSGNVTINGGLSANPANKNVSIAPTGTGTATINPATAGTMDNMAIGGTTPLAGTFTTLRVNSTISLAGSTGTAGYLIQSNGASAPTWVNPTGLTVGTATTATNATNVGVTDNTSSSATWYPTLVSTTTGNLPITTSSTKISFVPSTGTMTLGSLKLGGSTQNQQLGEGNSSIMKNRIINGSCVISQRGASPTITGGGDYSIDRFYNYYSGPVYTSVQSTTAPTGFVNSLKLTVTTPSASPTYSFFGQKIEGYNTANLGFGTASAKTVTLSFWVQSSVAGVYSFSLVNGNGDRSYPQTYTINSANTWQQITATVIGDTTGTWATDNNVGINIRFNVGSGSARLGTSGSWQVGNYDGATGSTGASTWANTSGATFYITGVQLEVGSYATGYEYRQYQQELALCQRYYYLVAKDSLYQASNAIIGQGWAFGATEIDCMIPIPVTMRSTPTISQTTGTNYYSARNGSTLVSFNSWSGSQYFSGNALNIYASGLSGLTSGLSGYCYTNASAQIGLSSEL